MPEVFNMKPPSAPRLRIVVQVFESAGMAGPWAEVIVSEVIREVPMKDGAVDPRFYRSKMSLQMVPQ
jgi:hypothetical protein